MNQSNLFIGKFLMTIKKFSITKNLTFINLEDQINTTPYLFLQD